MQGTLLSIHYQYFMKVERISDFGECCGRMPHKIGLLRNVSGTTDYRYSDLVSFGEIIIG
jgi:hypothetical protein